MDDDPDLHWTWFIAGAVVVLVLSNPRIRFWAADLLIDLGIWIQTDDDTRKVERMLQTWGRERRERQRRNGKPPISGGGL